MDLPLKIILTLWIISFVFWGLAKGTLYTNRHSLEEKLSTHETLSDWFSWIFLTATLSSIVYALNYIWRVA